MYITSLAIYKAIGSKEGIAHNYKIQGDLYMARGQLDQAEVFFQQSLAINDELGRSVDVAILYVSLGILYQKQDELTHAEEMYRKGLTLFEVLGITDKIKTTKHLLATARK